jgi:predicted ribosome quality control (RQC) complex YloA/Tae2 family protein
VRQIPGSHVVLKTEGREPDEQSIREAALLAAYYSAARDAKNVAVDYTQVRYVKKPGGAKPGMVTYGNNRTVYVTPEKEAVERLREGC